jgi:hypothetical protein
MSDNAPFVNSESPNYQKPSGNARQVFPGSNSEQFRPSLIKRDSDVPGAFVKPMGGSDYSYAPAKNKKGY